MEQLDVLLRLMESLCVNALKTSEIILIILIENNSYLFIILGVTRTWPRLDSTLLQHLLLED